MTSNQYRANCSKVMRPPFANSRFFSFSKSKGRFWGEFPVQPGRGLNQVRVIVPNTRSIFFERPVLGKAVRIVTFKAGSKGLSQKARFR